MDLAGLPEAAEQQLRNQVAAAAGGLLAAESDGDYDSVFAILSVFGPAIDDFFDSVRVNVTEPSLKAARHAFLREIHGLFARYADFAKVAPGE